MRSVTLLNVLRGLRGAISRSAWCLHLLIMDMKMTSGH